MPTKRLPVLKKDKLKRKRNRRLTAIMLLLFAALLAVIFFRSSVSRISDIAFTGNQYTTEAELLHKSGLAVGGQYFAVSADDVSAALEELATVEEAQVSKKFPGQVSVTVKEYQPVAYELSAEGELTAILSSGADVPVSEKGIAVEKPILTGWKADDPYKAKLSKVLGEIPNELTGDISEIVPSPTLSFPDRIKMYTRSRFEVITAVSLLEDKIGYLGRVIELEQPGLIRMLEADSYVPFVKAPETDGSEGAEVQGEATNDGDGQE